MIKFLTEYSALHGVPQNIRVDQATGFTSAEFENFCENTGINIIPCPIEDHRANGLVERCIQTLKRRLATCVLDNRSDLNLSVAKILESIRTTKHSVDKKSPFEMHFGRKPNTLFSNTLKKLGISDSYLKRPMLKPDEMESEI